MALQIRSKAQAGGRLRDTFLNPITGLMPTVKKGIRPW
jgi:hypothetical protein